MAAGVRLCLRRCRDKPRAPPLPCACRRAPLTIRQATACFSQRPHPVLPHRPPILWRILRRRRGRARSLLAPERRLRRGRPCRARRPLLRVRGLRRCSRRPPRRVPPDLRVRRRRWRRPEPGQSRVPQPRAPVRRFSVLLLLLLRPLPPSLRRDRCKRSINSSRVRRLHRLHLRRSPRIAARCRGRAIPIRRCNSPVRSTRWIGAFRPAAPGQPFSRSMCPCQRGARISARHPFVIAGNLLLTLLFLLTIGAGVGFVVGKQRFEAPGPAGRGQGRQRPARRRARHG